MPNEWGDRNKERSESVYIQSCRDNHDVYVKRFFRNNLFLLSKSGKSIYKQVNEICENSGVFLKKSYIYKLHSGRRIDPNILILSIFCKYWGEELGDMLTIDYAERERLNSEIGL